MASGTERVHYPAIDFLRGVAVLWTLIHHGAHFLRYSHLLPESIRPWHKMIAESGFLGVDMFFVISGFLITGILLEDINRGVGIKRFYLRRAFKILPQYFCVALPSLLLTSEVPCSVLRAHHYSCPPHTNFIHHLLFLQNYARETNPILAHTWSLSVEEHFYLVYPLIMLFAWKSAATRQRRFTVAACVITLLVASSNVLRYVVLGRHQDVLTFGAYIPFQTTLLRFDALMIGCLIKLGEAFVVANTPHKTISKWVFAAMSVAMYGYLIAHHKDAPTVWYYDLIAALAAASMIVALLLGPLRFTEIDAVRKIGRCSYGVYLWHYPILFIIEITYFSTTWVRVAVFLLTSYLAGVYSTRYIETWGLKLRQRLSP